MQNSEAVTQEYTVQRELILAEDMSDCRTVYHKRHTDVSCIESAHKQCNSVSKLSSDTD